MKHVPMVEMNPIEGVLTNVAGTRNVADACVEFGIRAMGGRCGSCKVGSNSSNWGF